VIPNIKYKMNNTPRSFNRYEVIYFLIWPFGILIESIREFRQPFSKNLFWLFCIYFGFVFIYSDPVTGGADSARYAAELIKLHNSQASPSDIINSFYSSNGKVDIYQPLATWLISLISDDPRLLFTLFAAVFGYFYAQNIWIVFGNINKKVDLILLLFMIAFVLINPIWNINGVRMWTAAQIFLYGCLRYFLKNEKQGLFWCLATVFVHFSFMFPTAILLLWLFLPKNINLFFVLYIISAFINEINLVELRNVLSFLPEVFQPRVEGYTAEGYAKHIGELKSQVNWHVIWAEYFKRSITYVWAIAIYIQRKKWKDFLPNFYQLFMLALFLGSIANIAVNIPSGGRFIVVYNLLFF